MPLAPRRSRASTYRRGEDSGSSKSLQKALRLLLHLGEKGSEMGVTQLAAELHLNKATAYRLLRTMQKFGLIEQNPSNERYRLGLRLHQLGCRALDSRRLHIEAHPFLVELARRSRESVSLAVRHETSILCLDRVDFPDCVISARTPVGGCFHAHCTAAGKAILAYLSIPEVRAIITQHGMHRFTSQTMDHYAPLWQNLDLTRHRGYATDHGESELGLTGIAAPVFMRGTHAVAALGMAGPTQRFSGDHFDPKVAMLKDFANRISRAMGRLTSELPVPVNRPYWDPFG